MSGKNLYGETFRPGFEGGSFNRCSHGYTGLKGSCWRCGITHPVRYARDLWWDIRHGSE